MLLHMISPSKTFGSFILNTSISPFIEPIFGAIFLDPLYFPALLNVKRRIIDHLEPKHYKIKKTEVKLLPHLKP
jgi:hypothetical protein